MFFDFDNIPLQKTNKEGALELVKLNGRFLEKLAKNQRKDPEIVLEAIKERAECFEFAHFDLQNNKNFIAQALQVNAEIYQYLNTNFKKDPDLAFLAMTVDDGQYYKMLKYADQSVKNNPEFILKIGTQNEMCLLGVEPDCFTIKLTKKLLSKNPLNFTTLPKHCYANISIVKKALTVDGDYYSYIDGSLKGNENLIYLALKNSEDDVALWAYIVESNPEVLIKYKSIDRFKRAYEINVEKDQLNQKVTEGIKSAKPKFL